MMGRFGDAIKIYQKSIECFEKLTYHNSESKLNSSLIFSMLGLVFKYKRDRVNTEIYLQKSLSRFKENNFDEQEYLYELAQFYMYIALIQEYLD